MCHVCCPSLFPTQQLFYYSRSIIARETTPTPILVTPTGVQASLSPPQSPLGRGVPPAGAPRRCIQWTTDRQQCRRAPIPAKFRALGNTGSPPANGVKYSEVYDTLPLNGLLYRVAVSTWSVSSLSSLQSQAEQIQALVTS